MFNIDKAENKERELKKKKRNMIFEELPQDWTVRNRLQIALEATKLSFYAPKYYEPTFNNAMDNFAKVIEVQNLWSDTLSEFKQTVKDLDRLAQSGLIKAITIEAAMTTGVSLNDINRVIETFLLACEKNDLMHFDIPKRKSINKKTEARKHDLVVGNLLIKAGLSRAKAAKILAKIRIIDPYAGLTDFSKKAKVVDDELKEAKTIEQCLRNEGL